MNPTETQVLGKRRAEECGLMRQQLSAGPDSPWQLVYSADAVHALLSAGHEVYGETDCIDDRNVVWFRGNLPEHREFKGLVINIKATPKPTREEQLEDTLRGLIAQLECEAANVGMIARSELLDRARKLLAKDAA